MKGDGTLFTAWMDSVLRGSTQITCAKDQRFSPISVDDVADAIVATIDNDCIGTYHIAGPKAYSRVELLMMLLEKLSERIRLDVNVKTCNNNDFELSEVRPIDVSMSPSKFIRDTGMQFQETDKMCDRIIDEYLFKNESEPIRYGD